MCKRYAVIYLKIICQHFLEVIIKVAEISGSWQWVSRKQFLPTACRLRSVAQCIQCTAQYFNIQWNILFKKNVLTHYFKWCFCNFSTSCLKRRVKNESNLEIRQHGQLLKIMTNEFDLRRQIYSTSYGKQQELGGVMFTMSTLSAYLSNDQHV